MSQLVVSVLIYLIEIAQNEKKSMSKSLCNIIKALKVFYLINTSIKDLLINSISCGNLYLIQMHTTFVCYVFKIENGKKQEKYILTTRIESADGTNRIKSKVMFVLLMASSDIIENYVFTKVLFLLVIYYFINPVFILLFQIYLKMFKRTFDYLLKDCYYLKKL